MGIFTLWVHHFVQHQLTDAVFVNPATVFVPIPTHNEIMLFGSVLATLIVNGCDATNVLLLQDATGEEKCSILLSISVDSRRKKFSVKFVSATTSRIRISSALSHLCYHF